MNVMKLRQVNKDMKCPACGKFSMMEHHGYEWTGSNEVIMWDYCCSSCNAKFATVQPRYRK